MGIADVHSAGEFRHNSNALDGRFGSTPEITLAGSIDDPAVFEPDRAGLSGFFGIRQLLHNLALNKASQKRILENGQVNDLPIRYSCRRPEWERRSGLYFNTTIFLVSAYSPA